MPRLRVIALEKTGPNTYRYALWADVPTARQQFFASTSIMSVYKFATSGDIANLQSGAYVEYVGQVEVGSTQNMTQIQAILDATQQSFQNGITNNNRWQFYGTNLSSSGVWTTTGIA
jgi:hypothetical protein